MSFRVAIGVVIGALIVIPIVMNAAVSNKADAMCIPWWPTCECKMMPNPDKTSKIKCIPGANTKGCPTGVCFDTPKGGKVDGICVSKLKCKGQKFTDQQGNQQDAGGDQGGGDDKGKGGDEKGGEDKGKGGGEGGGGGMEAIKGILEAVKGLMKGGGGGGGQPPPPPPPGGQGGEQNRQQECAQRYQTSNPPPNPRANPVTGLFANPFADPCASYVPPNTSDSLLKQILPKTTLGDLLNVGKKDAENVSDDLYGKDEKVDDAPENVSGKLLGGLPVGGGDDVADEKQVAPKTAGDGGLDWQRLNITSGTRGNIEITDTGATVVAGARDTTTNTEVAGFYGADSVDTQPQGVVTRLCRNRPWSESVVAYVIPPSFFDSLCAWRGYQVGAPNPPSEPILNKQVRVGTKSSKPLPATTEASRPSVPAQVDIWSVPETVSLGTRTSIFWNTKGVESCLIKSPDGSFNENTLSGGAATVPLTGPTTFTISCLTIDNKPVTSYVTVQIAI
ncbi:MAG: hypothetical protein AAB947_01460 [Patescibacteria group bacterium]